MIPHLDTFWIKEIQFGSLYSPNNIKSNANTLIKLLVVKVGRL